MEYAAPTTNPISADVQGFLQKVFFWMFAGLLVTGVSAALIGSNDQLLTDITDNPLIIIGIVVAQLGLVITILAAINKLSPERRAAVLGALALYLDFINLFLILLRIFGRSR